MINYSVIATAVVVAGKGFSFIYDCLLFNIPIRRLMLCDVS